MFLRTGRNQASAWQKIKALRPPAPTVVKRVDLALVRNRDGVVVGAVNRAYRRQGQGRFRGASPVVLSSPRAARLIPADPDGRASVIRVNRAARRAR